MTLDPERVEIKISVGADQVDKVCAAFDLRDYDAKAADIWFCESLQHDSGGVSLSCSSGG